MAPLPKQNFRIGQELWTRFGAALDGAGEPLRVVLEVPRNGNRSAALVAFAEAVVDAHTHGRDLSRVLDELAEASSRAADAVRGNAGDDVG